MMLALFHLGGGEAILVLALVLILVGARKLPDISEGLGRGVDEFTKATREITDELAELAGGQRASEQDGHPFLAAITIALGIICVCLLVCGLFR